MSGERVKMEKETDPEGDDAEVTCPPMGTRRPCELVRTRPDSNSSLP